jgi:DNA-binding MarR family transcriptional regulator
VSQRRASDLKPTSDRGSRAALRAGIKRNCERYADDSALAALAVDVMMTLRRTSTAFERLLNAYTGEYALSPAKVTILMTLAGVEEHTLTPRDISRRASVSLGNLTALVESLETAKLIRRRRDPADGRASRLTLTPAGLTLLERFAPAHFRIVTEVFGGLSPRELTTLNELLDRVRDVLKSEAIVSFSREAVS